jgi:hypothetical protein
VIISTAGDTKGARTTVEAAAHDRLVNPGSPMLCCVPRKHAASFAIEDHDYWLKYQTNGPDGQVELCATGVTWVEYSMETELPSIVSIFLKSQKDLVGEVSGLELRLMDHSFSEGKKVYVEIGKLRCLSDLGKLTNAIRIRVFQALKLPETAMTDVLLLCGGAAAGSDAEATEALK